MRDDLVYAVQHSRRPCKLYVIDTMHQSHVGFAASVNAGIVDSSNEIELRSQFGAHTFVQVVTVDRSCSSTTTHQDNIRWTPSKKCYFRCKPTTTIFQSQIFEVHM